MASIDELEASAKPKETPKENCDPCKLPTFQTPICANCAFSGELAPHRTFRNGVGQAEKMRYCYNFSEFVPARVTFGCTMFEVKIDRGGD